MKRNNQGMTLVELIIVISILSIIMVSSFSIVGYLTGTKAKSAAYDIQAGFGKARIEAMSRSKGAIKKDVIFTIGLEDNNFYMQLDNTNTGYYSREIIGNTRLTMEAEDKAGNTYNIAKQPLQIYFNRTTGGLYENMYTQIRVTQGTVTYQIKIVPLTGKISLERV